MSLSRRQLAGRAGARIEPRPGGLTFGEGAGTVQGPHVLDGGLFLADGAPELDGLLGDLLLVAGHCRAGQLEDGLDVGRQLVVVRARYFDEALEARLPHSLVRAVRALAYDLRGWEGGARSGIERGAGGTPAIKTLEVQKPQQHLTQLKQQPPPPPNTQTNESCCIEKCGKAKATRLSRRQRRLGRAPASGSCARSRC